MSRTASTAAPRLLKLFETFSMRIMDSEDQTLVPAVDVDIRPHDEARAIGGQERHRIGDVVRRTPAAERHLGAPARLLLLQAAAKKQLIVQGSERIGQRLT